MIDDEKIIELFFKRDQQAIRELDIKYGKICHNLSYNIVNSRQDAEECVNDAYLGAWNAIPPVHPNPLLTLWNAASRYLHANLPKGTKTLPISEWEKEYATLSEQRTAEYTKLKETRAEVAELHNIRKCVDIALKADQPEQTRAKRHDLER